MAVSKAQQRAQNKWIAKAYDRVNLTLPKGQKEVVQAHATAHSESVNGFIGRAISETMERDTSQKSTGTPTRAVNPLEGILSPDTLKAAQTAAEATGEDIPAFVARAVESRVRRDKATWGFGINPATGKRIERAVAAPPTEQQSPTGAAKAAAVVDSEAAEGIDPEKIANELRLMFRGMELRCYNPDVPEYEKYGAKGVTICDEWRGDGGFSSFAEWCMENGYRPGLLIDRKDAAGPYSPDNCILKAR